MHPLHDYITKQLAERVKARQVVVWYDERAEFEDFVGELDGATMSAHPAPVAINGMQVQLATFDGSYLELRLNVESLVNGDSPTPLVIYLPRCSRDRRMSVLMELEKAGTTWEPQLNQFARSVLIAKFTQGVVDEMLTAGRKVSYQDLARAAADPVGGEPPSILRAIFHEIRGSEGLLAAWITDDSHDAEIVEKGATRELTQLIKSYLGLDLMGETSLQKIRVNGARYILATEFRLDLRCEPPSSLSAIQIPGTEGEKTAVRNLARHLRAEFPEPYILLADKLEAELGLRQAKLSPGALGAIDTFRFEERALLHHAGGLIVAGKFDEALQLVQARERSFWLDREASRKAQWEAVLHMAELGKLAAQIRHELSRANGNAGKWLESYVAADGWNRLDRTQRRLEALVARLDEEPEEQPLNLVRRAYDETCFAMADGFTKALEKSSWTVPKALHQTQVFSEILSARPKPVAYFMVDAMRFEMGLELAERLPKTSEVSVKPAVTALPSITPIGMAALLPGASANFTVIEQGGKLGSRIEQSFLPDVTARRKFAVARVPNLVDLTLDELLGLPASKLAKKVEGAQVVVVRSQEIDHAGENGFTVQARQIMDTVIDNIARALRKLAVAGVENAVISADHGHLFFATDRDESMRTDPPGGNTVELHRRCWIGRGGSTPPGCIRVPASALGYASDLEFVFPKASGVFRAGGDLAFHHGGTSLQEMVVPVLTVRTQGREEPKKASANIAATGIPGVLTNRIFSVSFSMGDQQLLLGAPKLQIRPLLMSGDKQVGAVLAVVDHPHDRTTGCVEVDANQSITIAFILNDDSVQSLRVVIQDPTTDAELYRSPNDIPVKLGV